MQSDDLWYCTCCAFFFYTFSNIAAAINPVSATRDECSLGNVTWTPINASKNYAFLSLYGKDCGIYLSEGLYIIPSLSSPVTK